MGFQDSVVRFFLFLVREMALESPCHQHLLLESWSVFPQFPMEQQLSFCPSGRSAAPREDWDETVLALQVRKKKKKQDLNAKAEAMSISHL